MRSRYIHPTYHLILEGASQKVGVGGGGSNERTNALKRVDERRCPFHKRSSFIFHSTSASMLIEWHLQLQLLEKKILQFYNGRSIQSTPPISFLSLIQVVRVNPG
ncbi:hypothetical protein EYC84_005251 [Monilinia fructicola]|uniref:Uncharacterized protein n=1 Tax=Monilinia fructicola TaxID=38448 RepID=A0A5M9JYU4_MONFR|nr:hypothetical protein EYC84_005251 [Monilinia fructicola]